MVRGFEYRRKKPALRVRKSTGFLVTEKDGKKKTEEVFAAFKMGLAAAPKREGHGWHLASVIALYTGLRYGDVATLDWKDVDLNRRLIALTPSKTRKSSGVVVTIPMADALYAEMLEAAKRHTANSRMAEAGVPSAVRQMICGWTNDAMARHYDHATHLKELTDAVSKI